MRIVRGPECPACGCEDSTERLGRRTCANCGRGFRANNGEWWAPAGADEPEAAQEPEPQQIDGVIFHPIRCPACGSKEVFVTSTRRPVRHHKCKACKHAFKSVEKD